MLETIKIDKLVHGGQGLGVLADGKKVFVWNSLPGETVEIELSTEKKSFAEGTATKIISASPDRVEPKDQVAYLSTSPWQIVSSEAEDRYKQAILEEVFENNTVPLTLQPFCSTEPRYGYRNKMEYSFWWDAGKKQVRLAHFARGSHERIAVDESSLAMASINGAGKKLIDFIKKNAIPSRELKSVVIRSQQDGATFIELRVINDRLKNMPWEKLGVAGFKLLATRRNAPPTEKMRFLGQWGSDSMSDKLLGSTYMYGTDGFFQIHVPIYEKALGDIKTFVKPRAAVVDLYAGVGSIGMSVTRGKLTCVESDTVSAEFARKNLASRKNARVVDATSESALQEIVRSSVLIVDPPRAGLHTKVVEKIVAEKPKMIVYLSCNPATQARDLDSLTEAGYHALFARGYNFFPATPHIECLVVLVHD